MVEYFSLLIILDGYKLDQPYALSCRGLRTQLRTSTLGLFALSYRASTYSMTQLRLLP